MAQALTHSYCSIICNLWYYPCLSLVPLSLAIPSLESLCGSDAWIASFPGWAEPGLWQSRDSDCGLGTGPSLHKVMGEQR